MTYANAYPVAAIHPDARARLQMLADMAVRNSLTADPLGDIAPRESTAKRDPLLDICADYVRQRETIPTVA